MNHFLLSPQKVLEQWRLFREDLVHKSEDEQLIEITKWFGVAPTVNFVIDWDDTSTWISPWDILYEGKLCDTSIAYLMFNTLTLLDWDEKRLQLEVLDDYRHKKQSMVVVIDNSKVLNFSLNEIVDYSDIMCYCRSIKKYILQNEKYVIVR